MNSTGSSLQPQRVIHLTSDLMLSSRVGQVCRRHGLSYQVVRDLESVSLLSNEATILIIDLQSPGWRADAYSSAQSNWKPTPHIMAYAQHVEKSLLAEAESLGIPTVLTRGQFDSRLNAPEKGTQLFSRNSS